MVKWVTPTRITMTTTTTRSFLAIVIVIASLVRAINGFLPIPLNGGASARTLSGTDARKLFGGYRITPKHCRATKTLPISDPRMNGPTICMFNHECAQRNGEVVGACMDGFLFGACCQIPNLQQVESTLINDAQNAYFQQYQQQKLQMQQIMSNPVAQSYENYGESMQQSIETSSNNNQAQKQTQQQQQTSSYQTISNESTTSKHRPEKQSSTTNRVASTTFRRPQDVHSSTENIASSSSTHSAQEIENSSSSSSSSGDNFSEPMRLVSTKKASPRPAFVSSTTPVNQPPLVHVNKESVKISSPSSPAHNDDFVMQVLSTLAPAYENEHITFTTEIPMKITGNTADRLSSESNSFEEESTATQMPVQLIEKPTTTTAQKESLKTQQQQQAETQQNQQQQQNTHHHNHLVLNINEFTHSDITHPGADADIVDDLQFSTGYGPQPAIVDAPKEEVAPIKNLNSPQTDQKYVLVQTISNDQSNKGNPTTSSSITTHVDSIESIILQLNNTNAGPIYSVVNQNEPNYGSSTTLSLHAGSSVSSAATDKQQSYYGSSTSPTMASSTESAVGYYEEIETKRPEHAQQQQQKYPAYLEPVTTNLNDYSADLLAESNNSGATASYKPEEHTPTYSSNSDESSAAVNEATMPNKNYNDVADAGHQTSEFNKMPVVGIAYPVDMSYMDEDGSLINEDESGYQKLTNPTTSQRPLDSSPTTSVYNGEESSAETETSYTKLPTVNDLKPYKRPVSSYIGVVTSPNYNQQPQSSTYNQQVPEEVSVTSHTTKVQEQYDSTSYQTAQTQKLTTISYVDTTVTTSKPSTSTIVTRPPYDSLVLSSSSLKPKPPKTAKPSKRPGLGNTKKTAKPSGSKRPQSPQQDYQKTGTNKAPTLNSYSTTSGNYNQQPTELYVATQKQPNNDFSSTGNRPEAVAQPSNSYAQATVEKLPAQPVQTYNVPSQPAVYYNQEQHISSPPSKSTRKPTTTNNRPISTSYVTGPNTPRPPTTSAYDNEVPPLVIANDKLDSFVQSTAQSISGLPKPLISNYQAPVYASAATPIQIEGSYDGPKQPGFVKIKATSRPPLPTVIITPKPTTNSYVKQQQQSGDSYDTNQRPSTTPIPAFASTSYVYSATITRRPDYAESTSEYVSLPALNSNDFYDPGYYGNQAVTKPTYAVPSDDRPAFPGYYGPTPTYPAFQIPGEKNEGSIEESYTSPNDFVNFPPVRNPNLNMSATSSAVTSDLELSTPAFVEDGILKDKMNTLVHKIVESLQGNFEALADIIDETAEPLTYQAPGTTTTATRKPSRKPVTTKTKTTTKKPVTRLTTKPPTRKPSVTTRKPATKRTTTRKPITTRRPSKKPTPTTTNAAPFQDEIIDEEDGDDINVSENEIGNGDTLGVGAGGRKIQCGVRPHVKSGRIVGGKGSTFGAYPWQVLVRESTWLGLFTKNKCGGVLITNKYVITAAHCQPGFLASLVAVMGEFDISGDLESKKAVTKNVKRVIVHRQYDPATFENDLALLELESGVQFDTHIVPICMPTDTADFTGRMATVTGWGRLKYGGGVPSVLQEVQVPVIENSVCQEMFHTAGHNKKILNSFLCAGYANGQKDSCEGDSGGPLVLQRPDGRYELAGTVSHGIKCAAPYLPGVYMRTTYYKPWLRSITGVK